MRQQPSHPPAEYVDLDDFLWRDYSNRTDWASWVAQRYAIDIRAAGRQYAAAIELQEALRASNTSITGPTRMHRLPPAWTRWLLGMVSALPFVETDRARW